MASISETVKDAARLLHTNSESPRLDAEVLLAAVLRMPRSALIAHGDAAVDSDQQRAYSQLISARAGGTPIAYLTGVREFWSLSLAVSPAVLVPRPETECLVERALALLARDAACAVLDLGTGSGAIALSIAHERPRWAVTGVDASAAALAVAAHNSRTLGLTRIHWRLSNWFDSLPGEKFDLIVANPPYIAAADPALQSLAAEPMLALSPGPTGLEALSAIIAQSPAHLHARGALVVEHGITQADAVAHMLRERGFESISTHLDFSGRPRVTLGIHTQH